MDKKQRDKILKIVKGNKLNYEWYNLRPILGHANWAIFFLLLGGREAGKSYSVTNFFVDQYKNKGIPFYWLRLTDTQAEKLLKNNAERLVDPDLRRKYNLNLKTIGNNVYEVEYGERVVNKKDGTTEIKKYEKKRTLFARVFSLSTFYADKGSIFDKDFLNDKNMRYNIAVDEFQREKNEKNTFDIMYALVNQLENLVRSTKDRLRIFFMGNTLEDASDVLCSFNFIPEKFGIYKLKKKRCVMHYIEPSEAYLKRREGTVADLLMPEASTFTNKIDVDKSLVNNKRLIKPDYVLKFSKSKNDWFTIWDGNTIKKYNGEHKPVIAMRPYIDEKYDSKQVKQYIDLFDKRCMLFKDLITFKQYQKQIEQLRPR